METKQVETDAIIPPGEGLAEELEVRGISPREFARQMRITPKLLVGILLGEKPITAEIALKLEHALSVPAQFWMNQESRYRLALARQKERQTA